MPTSIMPSKSQGTFNALQGYRDELEKSVKGIEAAMNGTLGELDAAVRGHAAHAEQFLQAGSRQLEDWARGALADAITIGRRNADFADRCIQRTIRHTAPDILERNLDQLVGQPGPSGDISPNIHGEPGPSAVGIFEGEGWFFVNAHPQRSGFRCESEKQQYPHRRGKETGYVGGCEKHQGNMPAPVKE